MKNTNTSEIVHRSVCVHISVSMGIHRYMSASQPVKFIIKDLRNHRSLSSKQCIYKIWFRLYMNYLMRLFWDNFELKIR